MTRAAPGDDGDRAAGRGRLADAMEGMNRSRLIAAGGDWLEGLLPLLFVLFWIVSQVFNVVRRVGGRQPPPAARPPAPPRPRPRAGEDDVRTELERQIEEFLKTSGRRAAPAGGAETTRPRPEPKPRTATPPPARPARPERGAGRAPVAVRPSPVGGVARHVEDAFGHELEHLAPGLGGEASAARETRPRAAAIVEMLRDPVTLRHAVLLREILDRPVERW